MQGPHLNTNIRNYWFHHVFFYVTPDCELGFQHSGHFFGQFLHPVRDALWCCRIFRKSHTLLGSRCWVFIFLWTGILFYLSPPELCWYPDLDLIDSFSGIFYIFLLWNIRRARTQNSKLKDCLGCDTRYPCCPPEYGDWGQRERESWDAAPGPAHYW